MTTRAAYVSPYAHRPYTSSEDSLKLFSQDDQIHIEALTSTVAACQTILDRFEIPGGTLEERVRFVCETLDFYAGTNHKEITE
jgi:hypothetical protein